MSRFHWVSDREPDDERWHAVAGSDLLAGSIRSGVETLCGRSIPVPDLVRPSVPDGVEACLPCVLGVWPTTCAGSR